MGIKDLVKKNKIFSNILRNLKFRKKYLKDMNSFIDHYMMSYKQTEDKLGYNICLISHSIEKGMGNQNPRIFGRDKVEELCLNIRYWENYNFDLESYYYKLALSTLFNYMSFFENHNWTDSIEYNNVKKFLKTYDNNKYDYSVGSYELSFNSIKNNANVDVVAFSRSRHSVRQFSNRTLDLQDLEFAVTNACLAPSACNRQYCKVYFIQDEKLINLCINNARGISGFELENIKFAVVTYDISGLISIDERNQGMFNAGLFSMNLVNGLHAKGIGSCFIQYSNDFEQEQEFKKALSIKDNEKVAVLLAIGYYPQKFNVLSSTRKNIEDIYRKI